MLKIAFVTPTWQRARFLSHVLFCVQSQRFDRLPAAVDARWFVLDDSPQYDRDFADLCRQPGHGIPVDYQWLETRLALGAKRNRLNQQALAWGADYICSIDDDDWYGPDYAQAMVALIDQSPAGLAGSSEDFYLDMQSGCILRFPPCGPWHSCHGVLCFNAAAARQSAYLDDRQSGEEPAFLKGRKVAQLPGIMLYHLGVIHSHNTVPKHKFARDPRVMTQLTLDDLPLLPASRDFYASLLNS